MIEATESIKEKLEELAIEASRPFCYVDYITVEVAEDGSARCPRCGSDDLMRELPGVGVEYGTDWIIEHLVREKGERVDIEEIYRDLLDEVYEPVKFGELEYSASHVLKTVDPIAFNMGADEYAQSLVEDGQLIQVDSSYFRLDSVMD